MTTSVILMSSSAQTCSCCPLTPPSISRECQRDRADDHHAFHEDAKPGDLSLHLGTRRFSSSKKFRTSKRASASRIEVFLEVTQLRIQAIACPDVEGPMGFSRHDEQVNLLICLYQGIDHSHRMPEGDSSVTRPMYQQELTL